MVLEVFGKICPEKYFLRVYDGRISFVTTEYGGYTSNIYILRENSTLIQKFTDTCVGLTEGGGEEELFNLMVPSFLRRIFGEEQSKKGIPKSNKIDHLQILGFGPHIPKSADELIRRWGFNKINTFLSDFSGSNKKKDFYENPKNHQYFSGNFHTEGLIQYSVENGQSTIKIVDKKSVHNGATYVGSQDLKFEGELISSPRHLRRNEEDRIILSKDLEKLVREGNYSTFINLSGKGTKIYFSEKSIYLGNSGENQTHKLLFTPPIFEEDINRYFCSLKEEEFCTPQIVEFAEHEINNREFLILKDPTFLDLTEKEKTYLSKKQADSAR